MIPARRRSVVDIALQEEAVVSVEGLRAPKRSIGFASAMLCFRHMTRVAAVGVLLLLSGVIIALIDGSLPALRTFGFWVSHQRTTGIRSPRSSARWRRSTARW